MGFEWKDVAAIGLSGFPKQVFESDEFMETTENIGKAIPNEISENNEWFGYLDYLGPIGKAIGYVGRGIAATDAATTAYADTGSASKAWYAGTAGTFGKSQDPSQFDVGGERYGWDSDDAFWGMVGNQIQGIGYMGSKTGTTKGNVGSATGIIGGLFQPEIDYGNDNIVEGESEVDYVGAIDTYGGYNLPNGLYDYLNRGVDIDISSMYNRELF